MTLTFLFCLSSTIVEIADDSPCAARSMVWAILNINESVSLLGAKSLQLLGMHALSGCEAVTYPIWS